MCKKSGKYIECDLEGCTNKRHYWPCDIKKRKNFFCCKEHYYEWRFGPNKDRGKPIVVTCDLEGCDNTRSITTYDLNTKKNFFCCEEHFHAFMRSSRPVCKRKECDNIVDRAPADVHAGYCSRDCAFIDSYEKIYPRTLKLRSIVKQRQARRELKDIYIAGLIGLPQEDIPEEFLKLKRAIIKRKRIQQLPGTITHKS